MPREDEPRQSQYQVRFGWGLDGVRGVASGVDVIVLVDVLGHLERSGSSADLLRELADHPASVVSGSLRNAAAIAGWALGQQGDRGDRFVIAVIAAGASPAAGEDGGASSRFALEDFLGAGAIVEALASAGIDYYSPEAASAAAAFTGLANATAHLIRASEGGRAMLAAGASDALDAALEADSSRSVPILREFTFPDGRSSITWEA